MTRAETKITELKEEIKVLEKEIPIEKRIELIQQKAKERDERNNQLHERLRSEYEMLRDKIFNEFEGRIIAISRTATVIKENDFTLPDDMLCTVGYVENEIQFSGKNWENLIIKNETGNCFVEVYRENHNGETEYYDDIFTPYYLDMEYDGDYTIPQCIECLKRSIELLNLFISKFGDFEKRFYDCVDNL